MKPLVGQKCLVIFDYRYGRMNDGPIESVINRVGKKYFTVEGHYGCRFNISDLKMDAGNWVSHKRVVIDFEDYKKEQEAEKLANDLHIIFLIPSSAAKRISLENLREMYRLANELDIYEDE